MNNHTYFSLVLLVLTLLLPVPAYPQVVTTPVYVDAQSGSDSNSGHSPASAWRSLEKVNSNTFGPGARILLKANSSWQGHLAPKGSGSAQQPIIIDKYGQGRKPNIDGNGLVGKGVLRLYNQSYWEIRNLELTNDATEAADRRGVEIKAGNYGIVTHIYLSGLEIHHVKGIPGNSLTSKLTAGIYLATIADDQTPTRFHDILIENCLIYEIDNQGIVLNNEVAHNDYPGTEQWHHRKFTQVRIRNNTIHHIAKNAMIIRLTEGGVVEHNLCYETALKTTGNTIFSRSALGTTFQFNEGYLNRSPDYDGSLYDPDFSSPGTVWQYSYSHDNAHGLVWFCTTRQDTGIVVRYNISQNDKGNLVYLNYPFTGASIYNNVFYIGKDLSPTIIRENPKNSHTYTFQNNIIYNESPTATYALSDSVIQDRHISHNTFFGHHPATEPADSYKQTSDPMFVNPGSGGIGLHTLDGYKLLLNSPALRSGILISHNGGFDIFSNKVPPKKLPNRGVYNGKGLKHTKKAVQKNNNLSGK